MSPAGTADLSQQAGLQPPKTIDDIVTDAQALNGKNGVAGIILPGKRTGAVSDIMGTLLTAQGNWWCDANGKTSLDVAAATKAVNFYTKVAKNAPSGLLNFSVDEASSGAAQGKAAMVISTTPSLQALEDPSKSSTVGKWGYAATSSADAEDCTVSSVAAVAGPSAPCSGPPVRGAAGMPIHLVAEERTHRCNAQASQAAPEPQRWRSRCTGGRDPRILHRSVTKLPTTFRLLSCSSSCSRRRVLQRATQCAPRGTSWQ